MKISLFWLFFAVEGGRYYKYAKPKAQKAAAKTQMMIRDADGVSFFKQPFLSKMGYFKAKNEGYDWLN